MPGEDSAFTLGRLSGPFLGASPPKFQVLGLLVSTLNKHSKRADLMEEGRGGSKRAGRETDGLARTLSLPCPSCVTLGKCLHFSVQLPRLWHGNNMAMRGPADAEQLAQ